MDSVNHFSYSRIEYSESGLNQVYKKKSERKFCFDDLILRGSNYILIDDHLIICGSNWKTKDSVCASFKINLQYLSKTFIFVWPISRIAYISKWYRDREFISQEETEQKKYFESMT